MPILSPGTTGRPFLSPATVFTEAVFFKIKRGRATVQNCYYFSVLFLWVKQDF